MLLVSLLLLLLLILLLFSPRQSVANTYQVTETHRWHPETMLPPELHPCSMQHKSESNSPQPGLPKSSCQGANGYSLLFLSRICTCTSANHSGVGSSPMCVGFRVEGMRPFEFEGRRGTALFRHAIIPWVCVSYHRQPAYRWCYSDNHRQYSYHPSPPASLL